MKTHTSKPSEISRTWYVVDASEAPLGRMAGAVASLLIGKGKTDYTPHVDSGDYVVVTNASKLKVTGGKMSAKKYHRHSGYPSGLTTETLAEVLDKEPTKAIYKAVGGMLPRNKLWDARLKRLKVYPGSEHQHTAQNPKQFLLKVGDKG